MKYWITLNRLLPVIAAGLLGTQAIALEGDPERGAAQAATCAACHQEDGRGMHNPAGESWPRLAGLDADYLARQLRHFRSGARQSASMAPFVANLDDVQIADLSAYYSAIPATQAGDDGEADAATLARGEQLANLGDWRRYLVSCSSCHGPQGNGVGSAFPAIAGQHAGYISDQLKAWRDGKRANDPQDLMGSIARRMNDDDIRAVAAWYARLTPESTTE